MSNNQHERTCIVCGKKYKYCHRCGQYNSNEVWRYMYCDVDCKEIFGICSAFAFGDINASEAKSELDKHNLSTIKVRHPQLVQNLKDIYGGAQDGIN